MVDEVVVGGDERPGEGEQIQIREAKGDCGWVGKRSQGLFSFNKAEQDMDICTVGPGEVMDEPV